MKGGEEKDKMAKESEWPKGYNECCMKHKRMKGTWMLILGLIFIGNAVYSWMNWWLLIGIILALCGLFKLVMPMGMCK